MRRTIITLLAVVSALLTTGSRGASEVDWADRGLGAYGPHGPVTAETAHFEGLTDEAAELASSELLASTRATWDEPIDFAIQLDYQLRIRRLIDSLDSSPEHIATVLAERELASREGLRVLGLYLTRDEWLEVDRRIELSDLAPMIAEEIVGPTLFQEMERAHFGPAFGGIWQDHNDGGRLKLAIVHGYLVDIDYLSSLVPRPTDLEVVFVDYSWDDLRKFADSIFAHVNGSTERFLVKVDVPSNRVVLQIAGDEYSPPADIPTDAITVMTNQDVDIRLAHKPSVNHAGGAQSAGLKISFWKDGQYGQACTWGLSGHTAAYNYLVSAGHCFIDQFWPTLTSVFGNFNVDVKQATSSGIEIARQPNTYVKAVDDADSDAARVASDYANTNCYHTPSGPCYFVMNGRRSLYGYTQGRLVCATLPFTGATGSYLCGEISGIVIYDFDVAWIEAEFIGTGGDSGSGIKSTTTVWEGVYHGGTTTHLFFSPAYNVKTDLAFDFNCVPSGGGWASCPVIP